MNDELHRRARAVFLEVATVDDEAARDQVDRLAGGDLELRAAVLRMIDAQQRADDAAMMTAPTQRPAPAPAHAHAFDRIVGTRIGPYKVLQSIGEGGFGSVFLAEQTEPVRRRVALKIIKLGMDTKQVIARFEAERQALALMDHPHIASVFDAGTTDAGRPYFVMEYVVGDAITAFADAYKLSIAERLELFAQVCAAVQHAHTKGIIHRDLKPGNVLVSMVDGRPFAKVIDFGIAKATSSPLTAKTLFTEHRQLIGTPEYMSPEQAEGSPDIDTRTDVYALGVLLYELLTSETPFDGKRLRSAAYAEMQRIIREEEPPAPSMRLSRAVGSLASTAEARKAEPIKLSASIRGELDWIVMKALDKDRARRYATPAQFAGDLENHRRGEPVTAAPPRRMYRAVKLMKRNKGPVVAGSAIAAALLVGLAGTGWGWHATSRVNTELLRQQDRAEEGVGEMMGILMGRSVGPIAPGISADTGEPATTDPLEFAVGFGIQLAEQLRDERDALQEQTAAAQWSAYTANVALASQAIDANDFPAARRWLAECAEDLRGWEWRFLHARAQSVLARYFGSRTSVSPGGDRLLTGDGSTMRILDIDGSFIKELVLPPGATVWSGIFSRDGSLCAIRHDPGDPDLGIELTRLVSTSAEHADAPEPAVDIPGRPVAIAPDGSSVVIWSSQVGAKSGVFDRSGRLVMDFNNDLLLRGNHAAAFNHDGSTLIATTDESLSIIDTATTSVRTLPVEASALAWSPSGERFALSTGEAIHVYTRAGDLELVLPDPDDRVTTTWLQFAGEDRLVAGKFGYDLVAWDLDGNEIVRVTAPHRGWWDAAVSPAGTHFAAVANEETLIVDLTTGDAMRSAEAMYATPTVAFTEDGSALATHRAGVVSIRDLRGRTIERMTLSGVDTREFVTVRDDRVVVRTVDDYGIEWIYAAVDALPRPLRSPLASLAPAEAGSNGDPGGALAVPSDAFGSAIEFAEADRRIEVRDGALVVQRLGDGVDVCTLRFDARIAAISLAGDGSTVLAKTVDGAVLVLTTPDG